MHIDELITPALLIDEKRLLTNISMMAQKSRKGRVQLRPHIKTHKCLEIAQLQYEHGAQGITVSTPAEAEVFIQNGFSDIILAYPIIPDKIATVLELAEQTSLKVLVDHPLMITALEAECVAARMELDVLLKIDCGYHRCGINPRSPKAITLAKQIDQAPPLHFAGILTHAGHAYKAKSAAELRRIAHTEQDLMITSARQLDQNQLPPKIVSIGSTPTAMATDQFIEGITEIRPGNYVFFDNTQVLLGSCSFDDCALSVLTSVVSVHSDYLIVDAGATTLSKDQGATHLAPDQGYGVIMTENGNAILASAKIETLSQEHGLIRFTDKTPLSNFKPGDHLRILPNHSCLTANLFDHYYVTKKSRIVSMWHIQRQRLTTPYKHAKN